MSNANSYRTHTCRELRLADAGQAVLFTYGEYATATEAKAAAALAEYYGG